MNPNKAAFFTERLMAIISGVQYQSHAELARTLANLADQADSTAALNQIQQLAVERADFHGVTK